MPTPPRALPVPHPGSGWQPRRRPSARTRRVTTSRSTSLAADSLTRVTADGTSTRPVWTPDGHRVAYATRRPDGRRIMWQPLDGTAAATSLFAGLQHRCGPGPGRQTATVSSLSRILPPRSTASRFCRLGRIGAAGVRCSRLRPSTCNRTVSPDGRWLAYTIASSVGPPQVFIRPLAGGARAPDHSLDGGGQPRWARDGTSSSTERRDALMRIPVRTITRAGARKEPRSCSTRDTSARPVRSAGLRRHRRRPAFPVRQTRRDRSDRNPPFHVVVNWFEELRRRVPVRR